MVSHHGELQVVVRVFYYGVVSKAAKSTAFLLGLGQALSDPVRAIAQALQLRHVRRQAAPNTAI